jgi:SPX domain protein involved in polyphosphate accumulation
MARLENKYLVPVARKEELLNDVMLYLKYDSFSEKRPEKEYTVRSIYLDSSALTLYYEKLAGIKIRNKFRIRGYNELTKDSPVFMEIKRKENEYITKDRAPILYSELNDFFNHKNLTKILNHTTEYEKRLRSAKNFVFYLTKDKLKPVINVVYEREALECKFGSGLRVTFDMNIRSYLTQTYDNLFDNTKMEILYPSSFILELKYSRVLPSWVPSIINKYSLRKEALSKYVLSVNWHLRNNILIHPI